MSIFGFAGFGGAFHSSQMLHLLQRMDDSAPRHTTAAKGVPDSLRSVTVLADANESAEQALEDWSRGLEWVEWLFSSVRQRNIRLHFEAPATESLPKLRIAWSSFARTSLPEDLIPHLVQAWKASEKGHLSALMKADEALDQILTEEQKKLSITAGHRLLKSTRGARYQGMLGHFRQACDSGTSKGHFLIIWAALGHFFQLSLTSVIAEYLRLEWSIGTRHLPDSPKLHHLSELTSRLMPKSVAELRMV